MFLKPSQPSSYTHLWNLGGNVPGSSIEVPESFVKPNQSTPPPTLEPKPMAPQDIEENLYCEPPAEIPAKLHYESHELLYTKPSEKSNKVRVQTGKF
jgi:hypothetical protein